MRTADDMKPLGQGNLCCGALTNSLDTDNEAFMNDFGAVLDSNEQKVTNSKKTRPSSVTMRAIMVSCYCYYIWEVLTHVQFRRCLFWVFLL